jgi:hypothetical protein
MVEYNSAIFRDRVVQESRSYAEFTMTPLKNNIPQIRQRCKSNLVPRRKCIKVTFTKE